MKQFLQIWLFYLSVIGLCHFVYEEVAMRHKYYTLGENRAVLFHEDKVGVVLVTIGRLQVQALLQVLRAHGAGLWNQAR